METRAKEPNFLLVGRFWMGDKSERLPNARSIMMFPPPYAILVLPYKAGPFDSTVIRSSAVGAFYRIDIVDSF